MPTIGRRCVPRLPRFSRRNNTCCRTSSLPTRTVVSYVLADGTTSRKSSPIRFFRREAWQSSSSNTYLPIRVCQKKISSGFVLLRFINHRQVCDHLITSAFNLLAILFREESEEILAREIGRYLRFLSKYYSRFPDSIYGMIEVREPLIESLLMSNHS